MAEQGKASGRLSKWIRELRSESKKIVWPSFNSVVKNTMVVIIVVIVVGAFIWAFDALAKFLLVDGIRLIVK